MHFTSLGFGASSIHMFQKGGFVFKFPFVLPKIFKDYGLYKYNGVSASINLEI